MNRIRKTLAMLLALPAMGVMLIAVGVMVLAVCVMALAAMLAAPAYFVMPKSFMEEEEEGYDIHF